MSTQSNSTEPETGEPELASTADLAASGDLTVCLTLEKADRGERMDHYYAQEGDWFFQIHVPKHSRPPSVANVRFTFLRLPYRVEWYTGRKGQLCQTWFQTAQEASVEAKRRNGTIHKEADAALEGTK